MIPSINICSIHIQVQVLEKCSLVEVVVLNKNLSECSQMLNEGAATTHLSQSVILQLRWNLCVL